MFSHSGLVDGYCSESIHDNCRGLPQTHAVSMYLCCQTKSLGIHCMNRSTKTLDSAASSRMPD